MNSNPVTAGCYRLNIVTGVPTTVKFGKQTESCEFTSINKKIMG